MARRTRKSSVDPSTIQVLHVWNRCVRQARLCGIDPVTGIDREYRKQWSRQRLEHLAGIFAIEVLTFAILENHTHQVLRSRPDIARSWTPETIARRWLSITPKYDRRTGEVLEPTPEAVQTIVNDIKLVEKLRRRLSDVSWWMRYYAQHIAVRANREDEAKGHFWEQRFMAHVLSDEESILKCMLYVDLNLVRAGIADSIEDSDYTGAKDRLDDLRVQLATGEPLEIRLECGSETLKWERLDPKFSGWLSPIEIDVTKPQVVDEQSSSSDSTVVRRARRVSDRGVLRVSLPKYLFLLDLVGRERRKDATGIIPPTAISVLAHLSIEPTGFIESVLMFGRRFKTRIYKRSVEKVDTPNKCPEARVAM